jgi:hypothetical protein
MHDWVTSLLVTITWGKKRELQIWNLRDCLDYIVSLKKSCNQSAKLLFLILNSYPPQPFDMAWKTESPYFQLLQVSLCILEFDSKQIWRCQNPCKQYSKKILASNWHWPCHPSYERA